MSEPDVQEQDIGIKGDLLRKISHDKDVVCGRLGDYVVEGIRRSLKHINLTGYILSFEETLVRDGCKYTKPISPLMTVRGKFDGREHPLNLSFQLIQKIGRDEVYFCRVWANVPHSESKFWEKMDEIIIGGLEHVTNP